MSDSTEKASANPGYPLTQWARALLRGTQKAAERAGLWRQVLVGMLDGSIRVGARAPLRDIPSWVTPQVLHGGFASGNLAASGPLQPHEQLWLDSLGLEQRLDLNLHFSSQEGRSELSRRLSDGCYRIHQAEESALLMATWLVEQGQNERAEALLSEIAPFFDRLRFYPVPHPRPLTIRRGVYRQTVGESVDTLREQRLHEQLEKMTEAITVWAPLYDRTVALFLETVEGPLPLLGERGSDGQPVLVGGWPCRRFPGDWQARASALLQEYAAARAHHKLCTKPDKKKENFCRLRAYLATCVKGPSRLDGRDVGRIRRLLAGYLTRRGEPSSARAQELRRRQIEDLAGPTRRELAAVLAERLAELPLDEGSVEVSNKLGPLSEQEAAKLGTRPGTALPASLLRKAEMSWEAPAEVLVDKGLLTSAESLAEVMPQLTAQVKAEAIADPALGRVYEATYRAFRNRRSLLLLNYQSQVRLEELPWISAVQPWLGGSGQAERDALEALRRTAALALTAFPHTQLPNKLIRELRSLAVDAGQPQPFVDELAADIFMGAFAPNFLRAARVAAGILKGTPYERYYGLPYDELGLLEPDSKGDLKQFASLCYSLAGNPGSGYSPVAYNGCVIEQAAILTTHNLAVLFGPLAVFERLGPRLPEMARHCFQRICHRQTLPMLNWRAQMQTVKDSAYAWRQMVFYLSLSGTARDFLSWAREHLSRQDPTFQKRFEPVFRGLEATVAGEAFDARGFHPGGGRRFLGWTTERHWLLKPVSEE